MGALTDRLVAVKAAVDPNLTPHRSSYVLAASARARQSGRVGNRGGLRETLPRGRVKIQSPGVAQLSGGTEHEAPTRIVTIPSIRAPE